MATADSNAFSVTIQAAGSGPTWLQGLAVNAWREITGTRLSDQPTLPAPNGSGAPQGKSDAWCGWHADKRNGRIYSAGQGGHDDYWGNEVNVCDLSANAPAWSQLLGPTPSGSVSFDSDHYADGRAASVHGYHTSIVYEGGNRLLRFPGGSRSKSGNPSQRITAFNLSSGAWDGSGSFGGLAPPASIGATNGAYAKHPTTEAVYGWFYNNAFARWNPGVPGSWTTLLSGASIPAAPFETAGACDPTRGTAGQCFFLGGGDSALPRVCHRYDIGTNTLTAITLTGVDIKSSNGIGLEYVAALDRYVACIPSGGGSSVYLITPTSGTSWACALLSTTGGGSIPSTSGNSAFAPFTKFLYLPTLGGCVFGPRWGSNLWFLRLH